MVRVSGFFAPRLSRLIVDSNLDLKGYRILNALLADGVKAAVDIDFQNRRILNLGAPQLSTDAARKAEVDSAVSAHKSASPLDHPDGSVTRSKLDKITLALILQYL